MIDYKNIVSNTHINDYKWWWMSWALKGPWDKAIHVSWNKIDTLLCGALIDWSNVKRTKKSNSNKTQNGLSLSTHISRMTIL